MKPDWLEIGRIVAPQGLNGQVRVYPASDFPERFLQPGQRWLLRPGRPELQPVELQSGYFLAGKGLYVIKLAGIDNRNEAEALRGCPLMVPASDRPPLAADEYHILDLIGLDVYNQGKRIGIVVDVLSAGNDLLEVRLESSSEEAHQEPESEEPTEQQPQRLNRQQRRNKTQSPEPKLVLIPFVMPIVPVVDLQKGRIEVTPPPGLIE